MAIDLKRHLVCNNKILPLVVRCRKIPVKIVKLSREKNVIEKCELFNNIDVTIDILYFHVIT